MSPRGHGQVAVDRPLRSLPQASAIPSVTPRPVQLLVLALLAALPLLGCAKPAEPPARWPR